MSDSRRRGYERDYGIKVYDYNALQRLYLEKWNRGTWESIMKKMRYNPQKDHQRIEDCVRWA